MNIFLYYPPVNPAHATENIIFPFDCNEMFVIIQKSVYNRDLFLDYFILSLGLLPNPIHLYRYHTVLSTVLSLAVFNHLKMLLFFLIPWFSILYLKPFLSFVHFILYSFFLYSLHFNESIILYHFLSIKFFVIYLLLLFSSFSRLSY